MKNLPVYKNLLNCSSASQVFNYFSTSLNDSITYWDYFVNWEKVLGNVQDFEIDLNTLNYLVGKENIEEEFKSLLSRQPSIARLIPMLLACRETDFKILTDFAEGNLQYSFLCSNMWTEFADYRGARKFVELLEGTARNRSTARFSASRHTRLDLIEESAF